MVNCIFEEETKKKMNQLIVVENFSFAWNGNVNFKLTIKVKLNLHVIIIQFNHKNNVILVIMKD